MLTFRRDGETMVSYGNQAAFMPREMADAIMEQQRALAAAQEALSAAHAMCRCDAPLFVVSD